MLSADTWSDTLLCVMRELSSGLTEKETEILPGIFGEALLALGEILDRLRFASEIAVRLDYFEAAENVTHLAVTTTDPFLLLAAASLCGNPAVKASIRNTAFKMVKSYPPGRIRIDPSAKARTFDEKRLHLQWLARGTC